MIWLRCTALLSVCHNLILAFILNDFLHRSFERGQGDKCPISATATRPGTGDGRIDSNSTVLVFSYLYTTDYDSKVNIVVCNGEKTSNVRVYIFRLTRMDHSHE